MSATSRAPAVSDRRRPPPRRRLAARRRRRGLLGILLLAACAIAAVMALPLFQKAITEFTLPLDYSGIIRTEAADKHLDPALVAAVIYAETKFDARTSPAGAEGLMQILPQTAEFLARRSGGSAFHISDLGTPAVNIAYGSYYLRYLLNEYSGNLTLALAAYNGGETNVNRWVADARARGQDFDAYDIPFPETRAYVLKVLQARKDYRKTYPAELGYR
jgi:soluble lytic murein transglycosylase